VPAREPKRTYSPAAIETWFDRLEGDWEKSFAEDEITLARELYRESQVRELQLDPGSIVVHRRKGREDVYSVVEWENGAPSVRSGTTNRLEGRALAAAGLYETEELVSTEISPLPPEERVCALPAPKSKPVEEPEKAQQPPLKMRLRLTATTQGVRLCGFWIEGDKETPAFAQGEGAPDSRKREMLIRVTGKARRAGFAFRPGRSDYILKDPLSIGSFVKNDLAKWKETFDVQADPRLAAFASGVHKVTIRAKAAEVSGRGVGLDWSAWIDGKVLAGAHAKAILRRPGRVLISPELGLLRMDTNQAGELADWTRQDAAEGTIPHYMLFSLFQSGTLPLELSESLETWRRDVMNPPTTEGEFPPFLRDYQRRGVSWMRHLLGNGCHCLLADEMGLGKTVQVLTILARECSPEKPGLIVCPASVVPVWKAEAAKFYPELSIRTLQSGHTWENVTGVAVWVSSYTQLRRHRALATDKEFSAAVLDEAQFIKNPDAKISQVCMALKAAKRIAVTGTPIENRELDLWTIFRFLMPGLLGSRARLEKLALNDPQTLRENLRKQVAPFVLRRSKTEVAAELPPKVESILSCPLTQIQESEYHRLAREGLASLGDDLTKSVQERTLPFFTLLTRLRQTCCDPGLLPWMDASPRQSGKILALLEKLRELVAHGRRAVVFSQFATLLSRVEKVLREEFPNLPIEMLTGQTPNREKPVSAFQKSKGAAIMLVSLKAGGTGITLSAAEYVFLLDPWWTPAVEAPAIDREHRIGQDRTVFIYRLIATGTIEERIELLKQQKKELFDGTVGRLADMSRFQNYFKSLGELIGTEAEIAAEDEGE